MTTIHRQQKSRTYKREPYDQGGRKCVEMFWCRTRVCCTWGSERGKVNVSQASPSAWCPLHPRHRFSPNLLECPTTFSLSLQSQQDKFDFDKFHQKIEDAKTKGGQVQADSNQLSQIMYLWQTYKIQKCPYLIFFGKLLYGGFGILMSQNDQAEKNLFLGLF